MSLARLDNGRFNEECGQQTADATSRSVLSDVAPSSSGKTLVMGSTSARFLGEYNPQLNKPIERRDMNTGVVLLPELTAELEKLRKESQTTNHKVTDDLKKYLNEAAKFGQLRK